MHGPLKLDPKVVRGGAVSQSDLAWRLLRHEEDGRGWLVCLQKDVRNREMHTFLICDLLCALPRVVTTMGHHLGLGDEAFYRHICGHLDPGQAPRPPELCTVSFWYL